MLPSAIDIYLTYSLGGLWARLLERWFGPSILGIGFRLRALAVLMRGTPCITRGSFIRVGSSFAGAVGIWSAALIIIYD